MNCKLWCSMAQWLAYLLPDPAALGSIPSIPIIDIVVVNQQRRLHESGLWLENFDRTHLVLASGKHVPQKLASNFFIVTHSRSNPG